MLITYEGWEKMNLINLLSAIGSIGTFIMALFYFVSVSIQLYQMKMSFLPALGFNQILMTHQGEHLTIRNMTTTEYHQQGDGFLKLYNMGAGAAKQLKIDIYIDKGHVLQEKYVSILPSKEGYMLPMNDEVFKELKRTVQNNDYESNLKIKIQFKHNVSRKAQTMYLKGKINYFNRHEDCDVYELQFIQTDEKDKM